MSKDWEKYQRKVADLFNTFGCQAETNAKVQGARGKHRIDVLVSFSNYGYKNTWVCECKFWSSSIPKEKVLALQAIIQDIGADKGLLFSESGFQAGAVSCAMNTNIILTSCDELEKNLKSYLVGSIIVKKLSEIVILKDRLFDLSYTKTIKYETDGNSRSGSFSTSSPPGHGKIYTTIAMLEETLKKAWNNGYPVTIYDYDSMCNKKIIAADISELVSYTEKLVKRAEEYIETYRDFKKEIAKRENNA